MLPAGYEARVLEPSPPSSTDPEWWADDPTAPGGAQGSLVTPIPGEGTTWDEMTATHPRLGDYATKHWLSRPGRLPRLPGGYTATRQALHQLAFFVLGPKRHAATGKLGLRYTHRGFGTPFFGNDEQVRMEAGRLVHQSGDGVAWLSPTTTGQACEFLAIPYLESWFPGFQDPLQPVGPTAHLPIDDEAAAVLADWFGFATLVLERFRRLTGPGASRVQLWPEHFDVAVEIPRRESGLRDSYGASPGDEQHPEPHLYVAPHFPVDRFDPYWNDAAFNGASLAYRRLLEAADPLDASLDFLTAGWHRLNPDD